MRWSSATSSMTNRSPTLLPTWRLTLSRVSQMRAQGLRLLHAALSEVVDGHTVAETGGSRARTQQREYVEPGSGQHA